MSPSEKLPEMIEGKTKDKGDGMQDSETVYYMAEAAEVTVVLNRNLKNVRDVPRFDLRLFSRLV